MEKWGQELNSIFKAICLFGDPFNNMMMKNTKFTKLLREAGLIKEAKEGKFSLDTSIESNYNYGLKINDVDVIFFKISLLTPNQKLGQSTISTSNQVNNLNVVNVLNSNSGKSVTWVKNEKKGSIVNSGSKIDFNTFINAIEIVAGQVFPNKPILHAIEQIVVNHILPLEKKFNSKGGESQIDFLRDKQNSPELVRSLFFSI